MESATQAAWASAAMTCLAVITALFKEAITARFYRPVLRLRISLREPDSLQTTVIVMRDSQTAWRGPNYYFRFWIENVGNLPAKDVQVFLYRIERVQGDQQREPLREFSPMSLRWANSSSQNEAALLQSLNPKMGKHCDFGSVASPENLTAAPLVGLGSGECSFDLVTEVFPLDQSNRLLPGKYRFSIKVAAANSLPVNYALTVNWTGRWADTRDRMFGENISIESIELL